LDSWAEALKLDPCQAEVLDDMAQVCLFADDTTLFCPEKALAMARCAVAQDGSRTPTYVRTLAFAEFYCGNTDAAIHRMRAAIALNPKSPGYHADLAFMEEQATEESGKAASRDATNQPISSGIAPEAP
jgi:cytochrome c-type biogenesis protein CcmH/NrfG